MGMAMAVYKVYPEEGVDIDQLAEKIKKVEKVREVKKEPIAFGLELLKVAIIVDDKKDNPEKYEELIRKVEGIRDMEMDSVNLIS